MAKNVYVGSTSSDRFEQKRLRLLGEVMDPHTHKHLKRIGPGSGWKCLDVGAGDGSVARWMAERVKPEGHVVATDINTRFLEETSAPHLEVRQHDITRDGIERDHFDLVHCRTVLMHLSEPGQALKRMVQALKPGGWLLVEETDYRSFGAAALDHSLASGFDRILGEMLEELQSSGVTDGFFGRRVRGMVEDFDWRQLEHEGVCTVFRGGEAGARYQRMNFCEMVRPHLPENRFDEHDFDLLERAFRDPSFYFVDRTLFSARGRKPAS